jgi:hypothetical protein
VIALAPDTSSAKAGQVLATPRKWETLGQDGVAAWGQCKGSGKSPYQTQVALGEIAFKCSCPSRKFPCKHGLGLLLLLAEQAALFTEKEQPPWVAEWLKIRSARAEKTKDKKEEAKPKSVDAAAQEKRAQSREKKVQAGLQELDVWLRDLVRGGLATAQSQPYRYWDAMAARLVDAQAPGVARRLRDIGGLAARRSEAGHAAQAHWREGELLDHLSRLHLLLQGFARRDQLAPEMQAEIRTLIGWTQNQKELLAQPDARDCWKVLHSRVEEEDRLRVGRTWLWGARTQRFALILQFAHGSTPLATTFAPGTELEAEMSFFPGAYPLRAVVKEQLSASQTFASSPPGVTIAEAINAYSRALSANPWLGAFPVLLEEVLPIPRDNGASWAVRDDADGGRELKISSQFADGWKLLALSGGYPLTVFGEWNGESFLPLAATNTATNDSRWSRF